MQYDCMSNIASSSCGSVIKLWCVQEGISALLPLLVVLSTRHCQLAMHRASLLSQEQSVVSISTRGMGCAMLDSQAARMLKPRFTNIDMALCFDQAELWDLDSYFSCFLGALARSKQLKRQQQQQAEAVATAEESKHAAVTAATAGQKAAAARMKQKLTQLSPMKGQLQHITGNGLGMHACFLDSIATSLYATSIAGCTCG